MAAPLPPLHAAVGADVSAEPAAAVTPPPPSERVGLRNLRLLARRHPPALRRASRRPRNSRRAARSSAASSCSPTRSSTRASRRASLALSHGEQAAHQHRAIGRPQAAAVQAGRPLPRAARRGNRAAAACARLSVRRLDPADRYDGKTVDLEVRTKDNWTLNPGVSFSRQGGENNTGAQIEEKNLLGTGQVLAARVGTRTSIAKRSRLRYSDPHFLHNVQPSRRLATRMRTTARPSSSCSTGRSTRSTRGSPAASTLDEPAQRAALRAGAQGRRVRASRGVLRGLRRRFERPAQRLGHALDRRRDVRARPIRSWCPARTARGRAARGP